MAKLLDQARKVADNESLMRTRGELMHELRKRGLSWRDIQRETGIPPSNAIRWERRYLASE